MKVSKEKMEQHLNTLKAALEFTNLHKSGDPLTNNPAYIVGYLSATLRYSIQMLENDELKSTGYKSTVIRKSERR